MCIPTVKLILVVNPTLASVQALRTVADKSLDRERRSPHPQSTPADLRWSRVKTSRLSRRCSCQSPIYSKGKRLGHWGIYDVVKALAEIAGVKDSHPHRGRHTIATEMILRKMDSVLARKIIRHKSEDSYACYGERA
jgi:hypothetical protein